MARDRYTWGTTFALPVDCVQPDYCSANSVFERIKAGNIRAKDRLTDTPRNKSGNCRNLKASYTLAFMRLVAADITKVMSPALISTFLFFQLVVLSSCYAADFDGYDSYYDALAGSTKFTGVSRSVSENWKGNTFYIQSTVSGSNLYCQVRKPLPTNDGESWSLNILVIVATYTCIF